MDNGVGADVEEPAAGRIDDLERLWCEIAKVLSDFRDGLGDDFEAIERILEITGRAAPDA